MTAKRLKRPCDPVQLGKLIGDILTGQLTDHVDDQEQELTSAQKFAQSGGLKGGKARAAKLTPAQRHEIAAKAAKARWGQRNK